MPLNPIRLAEPNTSVSRDQITNGGKMFVNLTNNAYHASDGVSKSGLDKINQSPAHFALPSKPPTRAMAIGSAVHAAILEPDTFAAEYVFVDAKDRRQKQWKDAVAAFGEDFCLLPDDAQNIAQIQRAISKHSIARELTEQPGFRELSCFAFDPETDVLTRSRFDLVTDDAIAVDVKTTRNARAEDFSRSIANFRYHVQAAFYSDVFEWITGTPLQRFYFVCVETEPPYTVAVYHLDDQSLAIGRHEYRQDLNHYADCLRADNWPKYEPDSMFISLPGWKIAEHENEVDISL